LDFFDTLERLQWIHELILREATGTPDELARRFRLSKRHVYNMLDKLREKDAIIEYSNIKRTYYYVEEFEFRVTIGPRKKY
jgi:predicted DNA-binding transcriptional regulator YafY